ncbi:glycosyltransferase family 2 protein [Nostoc sp. LEGE 12447]|uniref:glycosyltransferase family 2 protein n=1 Tax=Nostoc sp. LEGE 12447 TaxID=1828640 RepID=UPI001883A83A|nr:glycosyltransferase family 2 protein [Nostoc sp. LEGE 12447]MBE9003391.1 glycosyltransferase family 2 protein [Nostoc sp. LEGE 12447]
MVIDILVPVFNLLEKTILFVESLSNQIEHRLIIIDNGSNQETKEYLNSLNAFVITNKSNEGYVKGMNKGLKYIENDYVLFANNDIILPEGLLKRLKDHLNSYDIVGPLSNKVYSSQENDCNKLLVDFDVSQTSIEEFSNYLYQKYYGQVESVDMVYGHCMLMKRTVLDSVGFLDEVYGLGNYDDADFCRRAIDIGMKVGLAKDSFVYHFCHATFDSMGINVDELINSNEKIYKDKWA